MDIKIEPSDDLQSQNSTETALNDNGYQNYCHEEKYSLEIKYEEDNDVSEKKIKTEWVGIKQKEENFPRQNCKKKVTHDDSPLEIEMFDMDEWLNAEVPDKNPAAPNSSSSLLPFADPLDDIHIEKLDAEKEVLAIKPVVVVVNLLSRSFHDTNFVCSVCSNIYSSLRLLQAHQSTHDESKSSMNYFGDESPRLQFGNRKRLFKCGLCDYISAFRSAIKTHQFLLSGVRPFKCDHCEFTCARKHSLKDHNVIHTNEKSLECELCDYKSGRSSGMRQHKRSHSADKAFECDICEYKSVWRSALKSHKLTHTGERPFKCDQCEYAAARKKDLKEHKAMHTTEKPFKCDLCDFESLWRSALTQHKTAHTGRSFNCGDCDFSSAFESVLNQHKLSHTGKRPYKCDHCDFESAWRASVKRHRYSHTGERVFKCSRCKFTSGRRYIVTQHKMKHHVSN